MGDKEDYLTSYREFFENFAATVRPEDQLPVQVSGYTITEAELPGEVIYWTTQYLNEKQCPLPLLTPLRRIILDEVQTASKKEPKEFGYRADESVYIALRLMQAVTARVNSVCLRYLDNILLDTLPAPTSLREHRTVSAAHKNSRRQMEDRHVEISNLEALFGIQTTEPTSFYAVYDGHAGSAAATYCAAHLHQYLVESPHFATDLPHALRDAFLKTDDEFVLKTQTDKANGGSTAVVVTVRGKKLHCAWAGDSQALLAKRMRLMQLVHPHKPSRQDEKDRIEASGGTVMYWGTWRVNGQLAVSRAIGDSQYKPYVTARPEIATVELDGDEDFVVVACDGLWDFVSEDQVALSVYWQLAADPDDLKAVTKRLIVQAKRQGSTDNISVIVVFLKEPRDIAADNCSSPMDVGLDNALATAPPPFDADACKRQLEAAVADAAAADDNDNGVDNSDSDSEDLGPETAVDADDVDAEPRGQEPAPPTPPAHAVEEESHIDGALVDNVAESGEESEDEWNYFKGEGEQPRDDQNPSETPDEPPLSETPCQDNSAWETSSVDMNSSPLNPDAPVFIPGTVAGNDVLLAESPRKPLPMDDIELPDEAQFDTEAVVRPKELLDLDNCDQLNGHHNMSLDEAAKLNGNEKSLDSLGFGFSVGVDPEKAQDTSLIQDFERIQKDTTDFCDIQVFQTHTETNPFATEGNEELLERLKNKERDPMSMSFYQEKDDDTCDRLSSHEPDLNAVQTLPDSEDEELQTNGDYEHNDKENVYPEHHTDLLPAEEPNNDIIRIEERTDLLQNLLEFGQGDNNVDYNIIANNAQNLANIDFHSEIPQEAVLQTDTPESHKLLFEQIPEIPDGKSSELGFTADDMQDVSESEKDTRPFTPQDETSQDVEMESKLEDSPLEELQPELQFEPKEEHISSPVASPEPVQQIEEDKDSGVTSDSVLGFEAENEMEAPILEQKPNTSEPTNDVLSDDIEDFIGADLKEECVRPQDLEEKEIVLEAPEIKFESDFLTAEVPVTHELAESPLPAQSPVPSEASLPAESPHPAQSPLPTEHLIPSQSPLPTEDIASTQSPLPTENFLLSQSPLPTENAPSPFPLPTENHAPAQSPLHTEILAPAQSPLPTEHLAPAQSPLPTESPLPAAESPLPARSPLPSEEQRLKSPAHAEIPLPSESPLPAQSPLLDEASVPRESPLQAKSPIPADVASLPRESPLPSESPIPQAVIEPEIPVSQEFSLNFLSAPVEEPQTVEPSGPAPDIVPEPQPIFDTHSEPVTDLDIGISESRAQEICVPVTNEIHRDDGIVPDAGSATPPPTPAIEPAEEALAPAHPVEETAIAADIAPVEQKIDAATIAAAAGVVAAAAAATAVAAKSKTPAKKAPTTTSKTTPVTKSTLKPSATPASATKKPATPASKTTPSATKTTPAARTTPAAKTATTPKPASATKPAAPKTSLASKPAAKPAQVKEPTATTKPAPISRASATSRAAATTTAAKPAPISRAAATSRPAAAKPAPKPAAPRPAPAPARTAAAPRPAPATKVPAKPATTTKAPEKKPLTNGDVRAPIRRPTSTAAPASRPAPPKPASAPAPAARPAPRPTPRATATTTTKSTTAAPRPAPRSAPPRPALDKSSKELANKRATSNTQTNTAPPRTALNKAPTKSAPKAVSKKSVDGPKKPEEMNGLSNGTADVEPAKPPPSPPAQDNALLPDVIA